MLKLSLLFFGSEAAEEPGAIVSLFVLGIRAVELPIGKLLNCYCLLIVLGLKATELLAVEQLLLLPLEFLFLEQNIERS